MQLLLVRLEVVELLLDGRFLLLLFFVLGLELFLAAAAFRADLEQVDADAVLDYVNS